MDGYLADVRGVKVSVPGLNLGAIRTVGGDYNANDLSYVMNDEEALDAVVEAVRRMRRIVSRSSLPLMSNTRRHWQNGSNTPEWPVRQWTGACPAEERASILQAFAEIELRIQRNCQILTEGYDQPDVDAVVIARPTVHRLSTPRWWDERYACIPNKTDALVLDSTGASDDKSLQTFTRLMKTQKKAMPNNGTMAVDDDAEEQPMEQGESVGEWIRRASRLLPKRSAKRQRQWCKPSTCLQIEVAIVGNRSRRRLPFVSMIRGGLIYIETEMSFGQCWS